MTSRTGIPLRIRPAARIYPSTPSELALGLMEVRDRSADSRQPKLFWTAALPI
jgi:hypothetical protein